MKEFSFLLKGWRLIVGKTVAFDDSKLRANNSKKLVKYGFTTYTI